jgi:hypothetical protein
MSAANVQQVDSRLQLERLAGDVLDAAHPGGGEAQLARVRLGVSDQLGHILELVLRVMAEHLRRDADQRDRREVVDRIEAPLGDQQRADAVRVDVRELQRVAIGRRLRDQVGADGAGGAGLVLDDDRLSEALGQLGGHEARHRIGSAPRREAHEDLDRLRRPFLLREGDRGRDAGQGEGGHESSAFLAGFHLFS